MDARSGEVFDTLELTLNELVGSISAYNPSPAAAELLVKADTDLSYYLEDLTQHQRNFQLIQQLRQESEALDERTKTNLKALVDLRHELITSTPISLPPRDGKSAPLDANVLLKFAQQIARSTGAPTNGAGSASTIVKDAPVDSVEPIVKQELGTPQMMNGLDADSDAKAAVMSENNAAAREQGKALSSLKPDLQNWLMSPATQPNIFPWVAEDEARKSALSRIEETWIRDEDPATIGTG